jgi:hypothetical protein
MSRTTSTPVEWHLLKGYLRHLAKKVLCVLLAWVGIYFCTQWVAEGPPSLFSLPIGVTAGVLIGWWLAEDAVEHAGFTGLTLWTLLIVACWLPIAVAELTLGQITGWTMGFGRWMLVAAVLVMSMAATVWRASADD